MEFEFVALTDHIDAEPRQAFTTMSGGERVTVFKNSKSYTIARATCRHMGAPLSHGDGKAQMVCGVHKFCNAPADLHVPGFGFGSFIFRGTSDAPVDHVLEALGFTDNVPLHAIHSRALKGNFTRQMWIENTMDFVHVQSVHKYGFNKVLGAVCAPMYFSHGMSVGTAVINPEAIEGLAKVATLPKDAYFRQAAIGPNLSVTVFADVMFSIERIEDGLVGTYFFMRPDRFKIPKDHNFFKFVAGENDSILLEDANYLSTLDRSVYATGKLIDGQDDRIKHHRSYWATVK